MTQRLKHETGYSRRQSIWHRIELQHDTEGYNMSQRLYHGTEAKA